MKGCLRFVIIGVVVLLGLVALASLARNPSTSTPTAAGGGASNAAPIKPQAAAPTKAALPKVGEQATKEGWAMALNSMTASHEIGGTQFSKAKVAQGIFVVLTLTAKNLQQKTSNLNTWDFALKAPDGTEFKTSSDGASGLRLASPTVEPLSFAEEIQPGLQKSFALVFDVNPAVKAYVLTAAGVDFAVSLP